MYQKCILLHSLLGFFTLTPLLNFWTICVQNPIIEDYFLRNTEFDFDEIEIVNNRPMNIWLYAKCRKYIDQDNPKGDEALNDAEIEITGGYDGNPT